MEYASPGGSIKETHLLTILLQVTCNFLQTRPRYWNVLCCVVIGCRGHDVVPLHLPVAVSHALPSY